jgi:MFS family permease
MADGLWSADRRALTVGLTATITFAAAEALAVVTVMPLAARDLNGLSLYGFVFSAFLLGAMIGIVAAGRVTDRHGPALPYVTGILVFAIGLAIASLGPSMEVLIAGRALQGIGAGAVPAVAYVAIGRSLPDNLRARMMAVLSTAWVAPGLAGPALSAEVARLFGWRWVFLGLLPFIALTGPLAIPALVRLGRAAEPADSGHRLIDGIGVAAAAGLVLAGLTLAVGSASDSGQAGGAVSAGTGAAGTVVAGSVVVGSVVAGCLMVVAGCALGFGVLRRLMPAGTLSARHWLPATILIRALLTFCFFGADAFVTLTITILRQHSVVVAGVAVTGSTLAWTAGAWIQARMNDRWEGRRLVRIGLVVILCGIAGLTTVLSSDVAVIVGIVAWTVAGLAWAWPTHPPPCSCSKRHWPQARLHPSAQPRRRSAALGIGLGGAAIGAAVRLAGR